MAMMGVPNLVLLFLKLELAMWRKGMNNAALTLNTVTHHTVTPQRLRSGSMLLASNQVR
jgi:hypothetical protein